MIPKHANPYFLTEQTTVVSRAALREDDDDEREPLDVSMHPERAEMLARLENILKRSIEDVLPSSTNPKADGDDDRDGASRKKKRRKVEETKEEEPVAVPFRLLSGMAQPKPILLAPKAPRVIVSVPPPAADTKAEAKRRAARAREVAVDFDWIMDQSRKAYCPLPNASKKLKTVSARIPSPEPSLLLLEVPKPTPKPPHPASVDPTLPVKPSPHQHKVTTCSIITAETPASPPDVHKRSRRRGKSHQKPAIQPAFWRPQAGMGGKSLGYAWGYEGSWPVPEGETPRYWRDSMRKAVLE